MKHAELQQSLMQDLCRYIERQSEAPSLEQLAAQAQLSPTHLQRCFKAAIGVSPKEYAEGCRLKKLKQQLRSSDSVTQAMYESGFAAPSRLYERVETRLGMTPKQYRAQGEALPISYAFAKTPLGLVLLAGTDRGLCFLHFGESEAALQAQLAAEFPKAERTPMPTAQRADFDAWMQALHAYLEGSRLNLDLPLDIRGTAFQMKVWKYLQTIPAGSTQSYAEVAEAIGQPTAVRAVASACAKNRIGLAIPCHRVLRGSGALAGYRWGMERKRALLELERKA